MAHPAGAYPGFQEAWKDYEYYYSPLERMIIHRKFTPQHFSRRPWKFTGTHLYAWVERSTGRVKCLAWYLGKMEVPELVFFNEQTHTAIIKRVSKSCSVAMVTLFVIKHGNTLRNNWTFFWRHLYRVTPEKVL